LTFDQIAPDGSQPAKARELHLIERPDGMPTPSQFNVVERELPPLEHGQILIRNRFLSIDPAMRPPLSNGLTPLNSPIMSLAIGEIVASRNTRFPVGQKVVHREGLRDLALSDGTHVDIVSVEDEPLHWHLGALGFTGFTAYAGLFDVARIKPGETVFVSAAAGAVGSVAAQIARLTGCRVIGSAGSADKCAWLRDKARLDQVVNYNEQPLRKSLKEAAPSGIDVYFDNVGGSHLDATLPRMRMHGRVAICGMISAYNNKGALSEGVTTLATMMYNRITMRAFIWQDHVTIWPQFLQAMRQWLANGDLVTEETIYHGLEKAPDALIALLSGKNLGKMLIQLD
jgi:NADPH-dependent curcumin reductase CurA